MTGWRSALLVLALCLIATPAYADEAPVPHSRLFSFDDPELFESSGLVDRGRTVYTTNDSGDAAVVYGVDSRTGRTVSRTSYADSVTDVEALAPGAGGTVWAGDTGDNRGNRDEIAVYRLQPRDGHQSAPRFALSYPDGPHDAEALLVRPRTGRVLVVTKSPFGGTVYAAPRDLRTDGENRLTPLAQVSGLVTDGTFFPDGKHVLLRTYGAASVYTFPAFALLGTVRLPAQRQGEGISVSATGRVLVSSEGVRSDVLQIRLPRSLSAPAGVSGEAPLPASASSGEEDQGTGPRDAADWAGIGLVAAAIIAIGYLTLRGSRVRGPRGR